MHALCPLPAVPYHPQGKKTNDTASSVGRTRGVRQAADGKSTDGEEEGAGGSGGGGGDVLVYGDGDWYDDGGGYHDALGSLTG